MGGWEDERVRGLRCVKIKKHRNEEASKPNTMNSKDTLVNKFEKAGLITVIIIWVLRATIGPMFNFTLLVTTTLLAIYYLWFGFFIFNKMQPLDLLHQHNHSHINRFHIVTGIIMGIILSYSLIAIIFGFLFFPGIQTAMISAAALLLLFIIYVLAYDMVKKRHRKLCRRFYLRAAIVGVILAAFLFTPLETKLSILFGDHPNFRDAYLEYSENPDDEEAVERLREERSKFR